MATFNTKIMAIASVFMIISGTSYGARIGENMNTANRTTNDGQLNLYLRAVYIDTEIENELIEENFGGFSFGNELGGTAIGAVLDYDSPYWSDAIGVRASLYGVGKVHSETSSRDLFDDSDGRNEGFAKIGQAHVKLRHRTDDWHVGLDAGLGRFDAGTIVTKDTRAVPGSYRGSKLYLGKSGLDVGPLAGELSLDAAFIDRASPRDRRRTEHFRSLSGEVIDNVRTVGLTYDLQAVVLSYATGISKDYNRNTKYGLELKAPLGENSGVLLDAQYYDFRENGDLWTQDLAQGLAGYKSSANWTNINLGLLLDNWRFGASWTKAEAELDNGQLGHAYFDHADNADGRLDVWTRAGNDFNNDGEEAWQLAVEYSFSNHRLFDIPLDGLQMLATYKRGSFDATNPLTSETGDITERQYEYRIYYRFDEPNYTGLSVGLIYTDYDINEDFVALVSTQPENVVTGKETRVYLDYAF